MVGVRSLVVKRRKPGPTCVEVIATTMMVVTCLLTEDHWKTEATIITGCRLPPAAKSIINQSSQPFMPLLADGLHNLVVGLNQETHHAGSGRLGGLASCHSGLTAAK